MSKRIEYIDLAKGICILLVVYMHCQIEGEQLPSMESKLSTFRMPLYFILSGLFFKEYGGLLDFIIRKTNKLLIPFITFYFTIGIVMQILHNLYFHTHSNYLSLHFYFAFYYESFNSMPNAIWFLLCLFEVNCIFYLLLTVSTRVFSNKLVIYLLSITIGAIGYILGINNFNLPMWIDTSFTVMPFFCFGYYIKHNTTFLFSNDYNQYDIIIFFLCIITVYVLGDTAIYLKNTFILSFPSLYICGILGSIAVLILSRRLKYNLIISYVGRYSIIVLIVHHPIIKFLNDFFFWRFPFLFDNQFIRFFIVLLLSIGLIPIMRRYAPYVTAQKDLIQVR